jgi:hypothetical protein
MTKLEQVKQIENGKGVQFLLDAACEIFQNPIVMFDTNYDLKAYTDLVTDDPIWNEIVSTGTFSMKTQEFFAAECFTEEVANANKLVILKSSKLKYDRVISYIFNRDRIKVAVIVMVACNNSLSADDLIAFNAFAEKITAKIRNDEHYTAYGKIFHHELIGKILDGYIKDTRIYAPQIQILYDGFESYLYLAVVTVRQSGMRHDKLAFIRDLLMERYKSFKFAIYSDYIIILMSSKKDSFVVNRVLLRNKEFFEQYDIFAGISSSFESMYELRTYYDEAVIALKNGLNNKENKRIFLI